MADQSHNLLARPLSFADAFDRSYEIADEFFPISGDTRGYDGVYEYGDVKRHFRIALGNSLQLQFPEWVQLPTAVVADQLEDVAILLALHEVASMKVARI